MKVIGLDIALNHTGVAKSTCGPIPIETATICPPASPDLFARFDSILQSIAVIFREDDSEKLWVIEEPAYSRNAAHHSAVVGANILVRYFLWVKRQKIVMVPPNQLKKFVSGKGNSQKDAMMMEVLRRWGYVTKNSDEADAVGLCYIGMSIAGMWEPTNKEQRDIVHALLNGTPKRSKRKRETAT